MAERRLSVTEKSTFASQNGHYIHHSDSNNELSIGSTSRRSSTNLKNNPAFAAALEGNIQYIYRRFILYWYYY
jgi:hypothetical protein